MRKLKLIMDVDELLEGRGWLEKMVVELMVMVTNIEGEDSYRLLGV